MNLNKVADRFFEVDPWNVIEKKIDREHRLVAESIFSLANEYMGVRGYYEEGSILPSLRGSYFNGVYEVERSTNQLAYKGIVDRTHFMVNAVDWLYTVIIVDDERLLMGQSDISEYNRTLDMKHGVLVRSFVWNLKNGKRMKIIFERFLDMINVERAYQKIICIPLNFSGEIVIHVGLNLNSVHESRKKCYWEEIQYKFSEKGAALQGYTLSTKMFLSTAFFYKSNSLLYSEDIQEKLLVAKKITLCLNEGKESYIEKYIVNKVENMSIASNIDGWNEVLFFINSQEPPTEYSIAKEQQSVYWNSVWNNTDIEINGDEINQQGIRYCIFQLQQTYHGQSPLHNIGAKGLTGESYNGHTFWDTETYCLPFYLFNNLQAARSLLLYRYRTLPQAKERAKMLDCKGACFPVATLNGEEACDLWQHASLQFQPSTGVAYGLYHYYRVSNDKDFLFDYGAELLIEISRFLLSRGAWNQDKTGFGFYAVMGPDEFHMMVNHNCYTNYMAKKTFEFTLWVLELMKKEKEESYQKLMEKLEVRDEELKEFKLCAEKMIILYDKKTKLFEQHEGYFNLPHIDIKSIPMSDFPLYHHWSYDRIYRTDMIKQPDVLMFLFLFNHEFDFDTKKVNFEYYEPRTIHESSLSPSVHSILASEIGKDRQAYEFFSFATRMDLDNYNRNTGEGLHTTSIAAAWMNIVYGFGGLRSDGPVLKINPTLPADWNSYSFIITYKKNRIKVIVNKEKVVFLILDCGNEPAVFEIYGRIYVLGKSTEIPLSGYKRG